MGEEENGLLGLSLSLGSFGGNNNNQIISKSSHAQAFTKPPPSFPLNFFKPDNAFQAPYAAAGNIFSDLNQSLVVATTESEEENLVGVSSPNSTVSTSLSGKRSERDDGERLSSSPEEEEDGGGDAAGRKKLRLSKEQAAVLEETFKEHSTLSPKQKMALAKRLYLMPRQVEVWFQNRRARTKLKQTEVDCEYLRRCCEDLTEENRRLQREVSELRALKLGPHVYASPPTTLTMCPRCERVALSTSSSSASALPGHRQRPAVAIGSWAAVISPQSLDAATNRRPRA